MKHDLSKRERQIVEILYQSGESTANHVLEQLPGNPANATVRTQLRILEEKGVVTHRQDGKRFLYRPVVHRKTAAKSALRSVLNVFFNGSVENALAAHLSDPKAKISPEELQRLKKLIDEHPSQGD